MKVFCASPHALRRRLGRIEREYGRLTHTHPHSPHQLHKTQQPCCDLGLPHTTPHTTHHTTPRLATQQLLSFVGLKPALAGNEVERSKPDLASLTTFNAAYAQEVTWNAGAVYSGALLYGCGTCCNSPGVTAVDWRQACWLLEPAVLLPKARPFRIVPTATGQPFSASVPVEEVIWVCLQRIGAVRNLRHFGKPAASGKQPRTAQHTQPACFTASQVCCDGASLLVHILRDLGFSSEYLYGEVLLSPGVWTPPGHASVLVTLPEGQYVLDLGFAQRPIEPVKREEGLEQVGCAREATGSERSKRRAEHVPKQSAAAAHAVSSWQACAAGAEPCGCGPVGFAASRCTRTAGAGASRSWGAIGCWRCGHR
jgi:hypothetical protein